VGYWAISVLDLEKTSSFGSSIDPGEASIPQHISCQPSKVENGMLTVTLTLEKKKRKHKKCQTLAHGIRFVLQKLWLSRFRNGLI
jgi:hypothetical protein